MEETKNNLLTTQTHKKTEMVDLSEVFWRYFNHWRWILLSIMVAMVIGYFYSKMQIDVYQINASVLIKDPEKSGESKLLKDLGVESGGEIENEVEVFRSKRLLVGVVDSLGLNTSYYYQTIFNKPSELYTASPIKLKFDTDLLQNLNSKPLIFNIKQNDDEFDLEYSFSGVTKKLTVKSFPVSVQTSVGRCYLSSVSEKVSLVRPLIIVVQSTNVIISGLSVQAEVNKKNEIIALTTKTYNPKKGIDVLNKVIDSYNRDAMMQSNQSSVNTANFIEERLRLLTSELTEVEMKVENYKKSNNFTDISSEAAMYLKDSKNKEDQRVELEIQIKLVDFVEAFINNEKNSYQPIPNAGIADNSLGALLTKYNELLSVRSHLLETSSPENPVFETNSKQINSLKKVIDSSFRNAKRVMSIQLAEIKNGENRADSRISDIPRQEREFVEIMRNLPGQLLDL